MNIKIKKTLFRFTPPGPVVEVDEADDSLSDEEEETEAKPPSPKLEVTQEQTEGRKVGKGAESFFFFFKFKLQTMYARQYKCKSMIQCHQYFVKNQGH